MNLYGYIKFEESLPIKKELIGTKIPIEVNGYKGFILFPEFPTNIDINNADIITDHLIAPKQISTIFKSEIEDWGYICSIPSMDCELKAIALIFDIRKKFNYDLGNLLTEELNAEVQKIIKFIEIYKRCVYFREELPSIFLSDIVFIKEKSKKSASNLPITINCYVNSDEHYISKRDLVFVLLLVKYSKEPRLEYELLTNARKSHFKEDYRKAIIDLATAIEILLSSKIEEYFGMHKIPKEIQVALNEKYLGLKNLLKLFSKLKIRSPKLDLDNKLINLRNNAIHNGSIPSKKEIEVALSISQKLFDFYKQKIY